MPVQQAPPEGSTAAEGTAAGPDGGRPRLALVVAVTAWTLAGVGLVAALASGVPLGGESVFLFVDAMVAVVYGALGAIVLARRRHPVPWILALTALGDGLAVVGGGAMLLALGRPGWESVAPWGFLFGVAWVPGILALFTVVPWLVRNGPLGRVGTAGVVAGSLVSVGATVHQVFLRDVAGYWWAVAACLVGAAATADAVHRSRRGIPEDRVGMVWLAWGTGMMTVSFLPLTAPALAGWIPPVVVPLLHLAVQAVFPAAVLGVVLRQRLWGIDLAVSRTVTAGVLTLALLGVYVLVASVTTALLPEPSPVPGQVLAAAVVALTVQPSRTWVRRRVSRLVHGEAADRAASQRLGEQFTRSATAEDLLGGLTARIREGLRLESVEVHGAGRAPVREGHPTGPALVVPLLHGGREVGELRVTARPGESLGARGRRQLDDLGGILAAALALVHAGADLERERDRVTRARLAERRALRREIHDGLGPSLAGLRLGIQGARNLVGTDPDGAGAILDALQDELDLRIDDVRNLSRTLLPPTLEDLGLGAAVRELAEKLSSPGCAVRVRCPEASDLPAPVRTAAYGIIGEAVLNAVRHGSPTQVGVEVVVGPDRVRVEVADDGRGVRAGAPDGVGTRSMRERAEEQGGRLDRFPREGGGTVVVAVLPTGGQE
ncbi:histidine kinase [Kineococcus gynurae]|uniref:histidine kinase n=1 Tax=Kineococcus gynurae TaxID=452979 RepID=A0ABV5LS73_9ACTN